MPYRVLVVLAEPVDEEGLRVNKEAAEIDERLRIADARAYSAVFCHAATLAELRGALLRHKPEILHFAGHGTDSGLLLENEDGESRVVSPEEMAKLLRQCRKRLYAVIMNACYSSTNAKEFRRTGIPYLISMSDQIDDEGAIAFARAFYDGVGAGEDIKSAFQHGCTAYDEKIAECPPQKPPLAKSDAVLQLPVEAKGFRRCGKCENLIIGRLRPCQFCPKRDPISWLNVLKIAAGAMALVLAYLQWFAQPRLEFDGQLENGKLLRFKLVNHSFQPASLSELTVEDSVLRPDVAIERLTPREYPKVGWGEEARFRVDVNRVWWTSEERLNAHHAYLAPLAKKKITFKATVTHRGKPLQLEEQVEVRQLSTFLSPAGRGGAPIQ